MDAADVGIFIAFGAGLVSFLSPCVLPLIPSYVTFLTGLSLEDAQNARHTALVHALLFVSGFTIIFLALGAGATALGALMLDYRSVITRVGGALIIIFGLYLTGILNVTVLSRERRLHLADKPVGYLGSVVVGLAFGAGWTPCLGPILGTILFTATMTDLNRGMLLLFAYSMGLAVPFLMAALMLRHFLGFFARIRGSMVWITRVSGVILIVIGILLVTNYFTILASYMQSLTPRFLLDRM